MATTLDLDLSGSEQVVTCVDRDAGLQAVIAIDSTVLGPGLGGVRYRAYASLEGATVEAQRLAAAMTLKNAVAHVPYGGAKSVIMDLGTPPRGREHLIERFGECVRRLEGAYIPGVDMGTAPRDLAVMAGVGVDVSASTEDPSPWTARGVYNAIQAAVEFRLHTGDFDDVRVVVQGVGNVGSTLARLLKAAGAIVTIADVDQERATRLAQAIGATTIPPEDAATADCDVYAPCATARAVTAENIGKIRATVVAGGANDTLDTPECAVLLQERNIAYVPDFVANAGGVIRVHAIRSGWSHDRTAQAVNEIGPRVRDLARGSEQSGHTMLDAAHDLARMRIDAAARAAGDARTTR